MIAVAPRGMGQPPVVIKFGGELLEDVHRLELVVSTLARIAARTPLAVVHGGGREIDAALAAAGVAKRQVDGLRVTDEATLGVVVSVLAGTVNTRFVAALTTAGVPAVGLTGADAGCGRSDIAPPFRAANGSVVDLGRVGIPSDAADGRVLSVLTRDGFVPVVASIGLGRDGQLLNVNADTFAAHVAVRIAAGRLVIAGTTAGVLDETGRTVATLELSAIAEMVERGTATAGMIAKLRACERALLNGVAEVVIVDGRDQAALEAAASGTMPAGATRVIAEGVTQRARG